MMKSAVPIWVVSVCLWGWAGCTAAPGDPSSTVDMAGTGEPSGMCKEGDTKACGCLGSTTAGKRSCDASGKFGQCVCAGGTATEGGSGSGTSGGTTAQSACGTCDGCCDGTTCVPFADQTDTRCGIRGKSCNACSTGTCDTSNGKCVTAMGSGTCSSSCDGCCSPSDGCVAYMNTDSFACGVAGSACKACPIEGSLCDDAGQCTNKFAYYETYQISVRQIDENSYKCSAAAGGELNPDPYVCMGARDPNTNALMKDFDGNPVYGCSQRCTDMGLCNLMQNAGIISRKAADGTMVPVEFPGDAFTMGQIFVETWDWDGDGSAADLLGQGKLPVQMTLMPGTQLSAGPYTTDYNLGCTVPIKFEISYQF